MYNALCCQGDSSAVLNAETISIEYLGVAQFGSVLEWGSRGRRFESSHPDHFPKPKGFGFFIKVAATLDTTPPMLYNGVVAGKLPAVVKTTSKRLRVAANYPEALFI